MFGVLHVSVIMIIHRIKVIALTLHTDEGGFIQPCYRHVHLQKTFQNKQRSRLYSVFPFFLEH